MKKPAREWNLQESCLYKIRFGEDSPRMPLETPKCWKTREGDYVKQHLLFVVRIAIFFFCVCLSSGCNECKQRVPEWHFKELSCQMLESISLKNFAFAVWVPFARGGLHKSSKSGRRLQKSRSRRNPEEDAFRSRNSGEVLVENKRMLSIVLVVVPPSLYRYLVQHEVCAERRQKGFEKQLSRQVKFEDNVETYLSPKIMAEVSCGCHRMNFRENSPRSFCSTRGWQILRGQRILIPHLGTSIVGELFGEHCSDGISFSGGLLQQEAFEKSGRIVAFKKTLHTCICSDKWLNNRLTTSLSPKRSVKNGPLIILLAKMSNSIRQKVLWGFLATRGLHNNNNNSGVTFLPENAGAYKLHTRRIARRQTYFV